MTKMLFVRIHSDLTSARVSMGTVVMANNAMISTSAAMPTFARRMRCVKTRLAHLSVFVSQATLTKMERASMLTSVPVVISATNNQLVLIQMDTTIATVMLATVETVSRVVTLTSV